MGSFQVFGIATDSKQSELLNDSRPLLAQPSSSFYAKKQKLLQIEFETNPLDKKADYRFKAISKSLEIKYNAVRIYTIYNDDKFLTIVFSFSQLLTN